MSKYNWNRQLLVFKQITILGLFNDSGGSRNFEGGKTMYQSRGHLSQMHTTNYMPFMREKAAYYKNLSQWGRPPQLPSPKFAPLFNNKSYDYYTVMILYLFALITVVLVYCVLSIVVILINIILVMCDIDYYYYSYSIYVATLYIELDLIYCLRAIAASLLWRRGQQPPAKLGRRFSNLTGSRSVSARAIWSYGKFAANALLEALRMLLELELFACVVIVLRHIVELFRSSTAERERCCSTSDIFSERVVSTWTLLLIVEHLLEPCCIVVDADVQRGPSARRSPGVSWSVNGSGRVVPSHLIGSYRFIWSRLLIVDTPSEQFNACFSSLLVEVRVCRSTPEDR